MKKWMRWQEWVAIVAGAYAALAPLWTETTTRATWTMVVLGVATVTAAVASMAVPDNNITDGVVAVLGALFIAAPWVMSFSTTTAMAWTAWIVGALTLVVGALAWPEANRLHREHAAPSH